MAGSHARPDQLGICAGFASIGYGSASALRGFRMRLRSPRVVPLAAAACLVLSSAGCATVPPTPLSEGSRAALEGIIASVDTRPWSYDGNAVVLLDTAAHGRVTVQLPARWNLCKAPAIDVATLTVGKNARAIGTVDGEGQVVVCLDPADRLVAID